ncbi:MAG: hypothetical protein IJO52_09350 [Clostridia bacterium]|nr:hypothetical protein [Clostridia bacterium]
MIEKYVYKKDSFPIPVIEERKDYVNLYYKAWETAFINVDYIEKENWKPQLTCMPGVGKIWQWDSCIMAFITNYANGELSALNNLDNIYRLRDTKSGYMSMAYVIETEKEAFGERINPPLMAWAEWEAYLISGDFSRFEKVIPAIEGMFGFIENNRRRPCGLYWFEDSGSSGMDNSPRSGYPAVDLKGSDVCHVDLACQQALTAKCLANMYRVLGNKEKEELYNSENKRICDLINKYHWSDKGEFYYDFFARGSADDKVKLINIKTAAAFWTLICGAATGERAEKVIKHLFDPNEFYTPTPFASLAKDDLNYDPTGGYWLGGVWPPTNFAAIRGLYENGYSELSAEASKKFLDAMVKVDSDEKYGGIWEVYSPEENAPSTRENGILCRKNFVGWGGIAPITLLIENIIGLHFDASKNTVSFEITHDAESGIKNMNFNGGKISVVCTALSEKTGGSKIEVNCEKAFTLEVMTKYSKEVKVFDARPGKNIFEF